MYTEVRPWGRFLQFSENQKNTVKVLYINPNEELSLQTHKHRAELWYFFDSATVQLDKLLLDVREGQEIFVDIGTPHRIISKGNTVRVLEMSIGEFDENDEERIEDKYGRIIHKKNRSRSTTTH